MDQDEFLRNYLEEYRKTDGYKENHRLMTLCKKDWRIFLAERIGKTQGKFSKGEMLFWAAFLYEPEVGIQRLKQWIAWCKGKGTIGQQAYAVISEERLKKYVDAAMKEPQPKQQRESSVGILPSELSTDEALKYFARAKEKGIIGDNYKWLKGKQLLACFCREMSLKLDLGKGGRIAWKPFEKLFGVTKEKLRSNYNDIQKTGQTPSDIALVDSIFQ